TIFAQLRLPHPKFYSRMRSERGKKARVYANYSIVLKYRWTRKRVSQKKNGRARMIRTRPLGIQQAERLAFGDGVGVLAQEIERRRFLGCEIGLCRLHLLLRQFSEELDVAVALEARARRDEPAHDDVLLQAAEVIHLPRDRRFGKDARGLLETCRGDEGIGGERRLGNAKEQRTTRSRAAAVLNDAVVLLAEAELIHLLLEKERRITDVFHLHPAHHLAHDRLDVLIV